MLGKELNAELWCGQGDRFKRVWYLNWVQNLVESVYRRVSLRKGEKHWLDVSGGGSVIGNILRNFTGS